MHWGGAKERTAPTIRGPRGGDRRPQQPVEASQDELHLDEGPFLLIEAQKLSGSAYLPSRRRAFFALFMNEILPIP